MTDWRKIVPVVILLAGVLALPQLTQSKYILNLAILAGVAVMLAVTNHMILRTGVWFMGHIAFFAIGAYTLIVCRNLLGIGFWPALALGGLAASGVALALGYATSRVMGLPFCIISIAFVEVVRLTIKRIIGGRSVICQPPEGFLGFDFSDRANLYYLALALTGLIIFIMHRLDRSVVGANLKIIARDESLAESLGLNTVRYKVLIMALCCGLAGVAGGFFVSYINIVGHSSFGFLPSTMIIIGIVVGGQYSFWGPAIGAVFILLLPEFLTIEKANHQYIVYSLVVMASFFLLPRGLISLPRVIAGIVAGSKKGGEA